MKINIKNICLSSLILMMCGCGESFLDLAPLDKANERAFFTNPQDFDLAVIGIYNAVSERFLEQSGWAMKEMRSDNTEQHRLSLLGVSTPFNQINEFNIFADNSLVLDHWRTSYSVITRANVVITRMERVDFPFTENLRRQYLGEARFLRAYMYYNLVMMFGDVPMPIVEYASPTAAMEDGRVAKDIVYQQILEDLNLAVDYLPLKSQYPASQRGRLTQGAARTLLAKVYLTLKQNSNAESQLRAVINSGEYQLVSEYANIFRPNNKNNSESIFELQFRAGGLGTGSTYADAWIPFQAGRDIFGTGYLGGGGQGLNMPTLDIINAYEEGDRRKQASVAEFYTTLGGVRVNDPRILKFSSAPTRPLDSDDNFPVLRYADVLLMLAEAVGPTAEGWNMIDMIRTRAGLGPIDRNLNFMDALLKERRVELAFENHRWFDLLRFGKALDVMTAFIARRRIDTVPYRYSPVGDVNPNKLLYPIPLREIMINDRLTPNPGY